MFSNLEFFLVEALRSFRRSALMSFVAIGTITVSLFVFGVFLLLVVNLGSIVGSVSSKMDLAAYVNKDISLEEAGALQLTLAKIPGVEKIDFISRTEAWRQFKDEFGSQLDLDATMTNNPLPHTFNIKVRTPDILPKVAKEVSNFQLIDEVRYSGKFVDQMKSLLDAIRIGGASLVILIALATLLIVVNTIRLTVLARETDISIMKLVGATDIFVKWPFIIEGILLGVLGGLASFIILNFSYSAVLYKVSSALPFLPLMGDQRLLSLIYLTMVLLGTGLGMLGAYISVSRILNSEV
ncbi:ABC transporter permease [Candidatus Saganbacteria bacterium]|nr:ABC transporter permease [Candidatus Saganbacteria bacterium]